MGERDVYSVEIRSSGIARSSGDVSISEPSQTISVGPGRVRHRSHRFDSRIAALYCWAARFCLRHRYARRPTRVTAAGCVTAMFSRPLAIVWVGCRDAQRLPVAMDRGCWQFCITSAARVAQEERIAEVHATWSTAARLDPGLRVGKWTILGATRVDLGGVKWSKWRCSQSEADFSSHDVVGKGHSVTAENFRETKVWSYSPFTFLSYRLLIAIVRTCSPTQIELRLLALLLTPSFVSWSDTRSPLLGWLSQMAFNQCNGIGRVTSLVLGRRLLSAYFGRREWRSKVCQCVML